MTIAVNIPPIQFMYPGFVDDVEQLLAKSGLDPAPLEREITQHLLIREAHMVYLVLRQLKRLGCSITIDGVGTLEQLEALQRECCTFAQRFCLGQPMPISELGNLIGEGGHDRVAASA